MRHDEVLPSIPGKLLAVAGSALTGSQPTYYKMQRQPQCTSKYKYCKSIAGPAMAGAADEASMGRSGTRGKQTQAEAAEAAHAVSQISKCFYSIEDKV